MSSDRSRLLVMTVAGVSAALSSALLACSSPATPPVAPANAVNAVKPIEPPATAPKLDFTFDEEAIDGTAGFALDGAGATMLRVAADEDRGGKVLAMSSVQTSAAPAANRAGLVLSPEAVKALRGRRVDVTAQVDANGAPPLFAMIGLDLERGDGGLMRFRSPKTSRDGWETLQLTIDVPADAQNLGVWFFQSAEGEVRLDDLHLRDVGPAGAGDLPPRAITARGMQNLLALARLYGAVRYFHPSDEAANADWDRLLIGAIEPVEAAADARELAARLTAVFQPVAPSMTIAAGDKAPHNAIPAVAPATNAEPLRWRHRGVQMASSVAQICKSERVRSLMDESDMLLQNVDVSGRRGQTLQLSAFLRIDGTRGVVVVATTQKEDEPAFAAVKPPARPTQWTQVKLAIKIPADANTLTVMVRMNGPGQIVIDDASLRGSDKKELLVNGDFEQDSGSIYPVAWVAALGDAGYQRRAEHKGCHGGKSCASLTAPVQPESKPGEAVAMQLPGGVAAELPLVVWSLVGEVVPTTLPMGTGFRAPAQPHYATATDRSTRLASVMELWNVLQHFYPNFDVVKVDWMAQLPVALAAAATNATDEQLTETLERMMRELRDGHARVFYANGFRGELPIQLRLVEGHWMVTGVDPRALAQSGAVGANGLAPVAGGEELLAIDGQPVDKLAAALRARVSAATTQWEDVQVAQRLLAGDIGKNARLKLRRPSGEEGTVALPYVQWAIPREMARPAAAAELEPGIWYVDAAEVTEPMLMMELPKMANARGVILDLRGYTNRPALFQHLVDKPVATPWWLIPITIKPDREGTEFLKMNSPLAAVPPKLKGKIVVLADGRTISATETYLSIIKHQKLGTIVGEPSAGTNGDINPIALPSGHTVNWTGLRVQDPSGKPHHGAGVEPDVKVAPTVAGVRAKRDEVLERGLELIRGAKPATAPPAPAAPPAATAAPARP